MTMKDDHHHHQEQETPISMAAQKPSSSRNQASTSTATTRTSPHSVAPVPEDRSKKTTNRAGAVNSCCSRRGLVSKTTNEGDEADQKRVVLQGTSCTAAAGGAHDSMVAADHLQGEMNGRERLKRHRVEVAGRVWIPDIWGQEDLLKDWIDCTVFDSALGNNSIMLARAALVQERTTSVRIDNIC